MTNIYSLFPFICKKRKKKVLGLERPKRPVRAPTAGGQPHVGHQGKIHFSYLSEFHTCFLENETRTGQGLRCRMLSTMVPPTTCLPRTAVGSRSYRVGQIELVRDSGSTPAALLLPTVTTRHKTWRPLTRPLTLPPFLSLASQWCRPPASTTHTSMHHTLYNDNLA